MRNEIKNLRLIVESIANGMTPMHEAERLDIADAPLRKIKEDNFKEMREIDREVRKLANARPGVPLADGEENAVFSGHPELKDARDWCNAKDYLIQSAMDDRAMLENESARHAYEKYIEVDAKHPAYAWRNEPSRESVDEGVLGSVGKFGRRIATEIRGGNFYEDVDKLGGMKYSELKQKLESMDDNGLSSLISKAKHSKGDRASRVAKWAGIELDMRNSKNAKRSSGSGESWWSREAREYERSAKPTKYDSNGAYGSGNSSYEETGDPAYSSSGRHYNMFGDRIN